MNTTKLKLNETNPEQTLVQTMDGQEAGIYWVGDGQIHGWLAVNSGRRLMLWIMDGSSSYSDDRDRLVNKPAEPDWKVVKRIS